ncbi:MAG: GntR family transcriptional regulator [Pseudooceanicola sp.]|nr:GntR family transcriptional regulator [Pseudooceanicola sp.]
MQNTLTPGFSDAFANAPASSKVYAELRAQITALRLPPGTRLSRQELSDTFGVSQSPVREALMRLEQAGLVATYRQSRTEVTMIDRTRLRQEHFLRRGLECEVVHQLASKGGDVGKVAAVLKLQKALVDDIDRIDMFRQLDDSFHRELFAAAGQADLHAFVTEQSGHMARLRALDLPSTGKVEAVIEGHEAVLAAIQAGEAEGAADQMRRHLSGSIERLPQIVERFPDYFL